MRGLLLAVAMGLGAVIGVTGCDNISGGGGATPEAACTSLCDCEGFVGAEHAACVSECVSEVPPGIPTECFECLTTAACPLFPACAGVCGIDDDPQPEPGGNG